MINDTRYNNIQFNEFPNYFNDTTFVDCEFNKINFGVVDFTKVKFEGWIRFVSCNLEDANFNKADSSFSSTSSSGRFQFVSCNLQDANFEGADLSKFEFDDCFNIPQYVYDKTLIVPSWGT